MECKFFGTTHRDDALVGRDTVIAVFSHHPSWRMWLRSRKNCFVRKLGVLKYPRRRAESCNKEFPVKRNVIVGNFCKVNLGIFAIFDFLK